MRCGCNKQQQCSRLQLATSQAMQRMIVHCSRVPQVGATHQIHERTFRCTGLQFPSHCFDREECHGVFETPTNSVTHWWYCYITPRCSVNRTWTWAVYTSMCLQDHPRCTQQRRAGMAGYMQERCAYAMRSRVPAQLSSATTLSVCRAGKLPATP